MNTLALIVGLGNPGKEYVKTRHNAGFWLVEAWAAYERTDFQFESKFRAEVAVLKAKSGDVRFAKPQTYMNVSGEAVAALMRFYQIPLSALLVVHDELDLLPGVARLKMGGGHAGHNGLKSLEQHLGSRDFWRLRLGIGRPEHAGHDVADYVLGKPTNAEQQAIQQAIDDGLEITPKLLAGQMEAARQWLHSAPGHR